MAKVVEPKPWPKRGDSSDAITYEAVGRALTSWEHLEVSLSLTFATCMIAGVLAEGRSRLGIAINIARRSYGCVRTFEGRCSMLDEAVRGVLDRFPNEELLAVFKKLFGDARRLSGSRHEIAHSIVTNQVNGLDVGMPPSEYGYVIMPPLTATHWKLPDERPVFLHSSVEIKAIAMEFHDLHAQSETFRRNLSDHMQRSAYIAAGKVLFR